MGYFILFLIGVAARIVGGFGYDFLNSRLSRKKNKRLNEDKSDHIDTSGRTDSGRNSDADLQEEIHLKD